MEYIVFKAEWCKPCKALKKNITNLETKALLDTSRMRFVDIDDKEGNLEAQKHNIRGVPTIVKVNDEGLVSDTFVGYRTEDQLLQLLK